MNIHSQIKSFGSSTLVKNSLVYVITDGINKAIPFILLPFISRFLTPADYGIVSNYNVYIQILSVFVYLCTAGIIPVMFFKVDHENLKKVISNMIFINTAATIFFLMLSMIEYGYVNNYFSLPLIIQLVGIVSVWFSSITNINLILWRCEEKPLKFGAYQISQTLLNAVSTVLFVMILLWGWQGRVWSMMISCILMGFVSIYILKANDYVAFTIDRKSVKAVLAFSIPLIPHALSFWFKSGTDKILLTSLCGLTENGLYSVAMTWGAVVSLFLVAYNNSYSPYLYKKLAKFDKDKDGTLKEQYQLVKVIWISFVTTLLLVGVIYVVSYYLTVIIYPPSYYGSLEYLAMVMISQAFNGAYLLFVCFCHYTLRTKVLGVITFSLSLVQVLLSYLLILSCGSVGVAYSSAIVSILTFIFVAIYGMRVYNLPWFNFKLA